MNLQLENKTALVSGSTQGIGFAIAEALAIVRSSPVASCLGSSLPGRKLSRLAPTNVGTLCAFLTSREKCGLMPSLTSSSFAILSSPHSKLSRDISRIKRRSSAGIGGRPGFDFQCQRSRNPARCQRINVFGWTTTSPSRQLNNGVGRVPSAFRHFLSGTREKVNPPGLGPGD